MKLIPFLLFSILSINCFGQIKISKEDRLLLNDFVNKETRSKANLFYNQHFDTGYVSLLNRFFNPITEKGMGGFLYIDGKPSTFALAKNEAEILARSWLSQTNEIWDSTLLDSAKAIMLPALTEHTTKQEMIEYYAFLEEKTIITLSKPVLLRNKSVCILFFANNWGGELYILQKENGKWVKYLRKPMFVV